MDLEDGNSSATRERYFALPPVLDLAAAPALLHALRHYVTGTEPVVLDGHAVERVSTPCLQILLATAMDAQSRAVAFRLREPTAALSNAIAELGLATSFGH